MVLKQDMYTRYQGLADAWRLQLGADVCHDVQAGLNHEWLVTNGLGGYAGGSIVGATTRSYHGLLVAALHPPVERTVLVTKIDEEVTLPNGDLLKLGVNEYRDGTLDPIGNVHLATCFLEGDIPCFVYHLTDSVFLEKRIWMEYGQNTTYVQYSLRGTFMNDQNGTADAHQDALTVTLLPFCLARDYHSTTHGTVDWQFQVENQGNKCVVRAYPDAPACYLLADAHATFVPRKLWYWQVWHRRDYERGLPASEDVYQPGIFQMRLSPGMSRTLVLSAEERYAPELGGPLHERAVSQALMRHQRRVQHILTLVNQTGSDLQNRDPVLARLVVAADQFIVARPDYTTATRQPPRLSPDRKTIIAGYPWFTDWGRDSMISLPGLLLCTGRYSEARGLIKAMVSYMHNGLIPNRFPDQGEAPIYNSVDATLWLFRAIDRYLAATGDWSLVKELFPALRECIEWHVRGTEYGIGVDPADGLLHAGAPNVQLTWMDAKVDDWVVTPRRGKPVEVNALWYAALTSMEAWAVHLSTDATSYSQMRRRVQQHFAERFWYEEGGYLYDVVDVDGVAGQNDASMRPNQLFAASFNSNLLSDTQTVSMLQKVTEQLLTPIGLRSLSPTDPAYHKHFRGDRVQRDSAYHQGAVWPWLIGPYIDVSLRVQNDRAAIQPLLLPIVQRLWENCIGSITEVTEPEAPFEAGGCFAQAWSVAELLRCWLLLNG